MNTPLPRRILLSPPPSLPRNGFLAFAPLFSTGLLALFLLVCPLSSQAQTWSGQDIGSVNFSGSESFNASTGTYTLQGAGADIWGGADAFYFLSQPLSQDGELVVRVASVQNTNASAKAGVMVRQNAGAGSVNALLALTPSQGVTFQWRAGTGGSTANHAVGGIGAPRWLKLVKDATLLSAYDSADGAAWLYVGAVRLGSLSAPVQIGLAVTSHNAGAICSATFDHLALTNATTFAPAAPWLFGDVGGVGQAGQPHEEENLWSLFGAGTGVGGTADSLHFVYQALRGNGVILAQVNSLAGAGNPAAALLLRQNLTAGAAGAALLLPAATGKPSLVTRASAGVAAATVATAATATPPPAWLRLVRLGGTFYGYTSADGRAWTLLGSQSVALSDPIDVGLGVSSGSTGSLGLGVFDWVSVQPFGDYLQTGALAQGASHTLRLRSDGSVWASGLNSNGQLGDGTTTPRLSPVAVSALSAIQRVAAGQSHSLALKGDGSVWSWGLNASGQLGNGTTTQANTPASIGGLGGAGIVGISGGANFSLAWSNDGSVWSFGANNAGQLGDGTTTQRPSPVHLTSLSGIVEASAGAGHGLARQSGGAVYAWGGNASGQVGDGTTTQRTAPVKLASLANIVAVSAGASHSLALDAYGQVYAWGDNSAGELGDGTTTGRSSPVAVPGLSHIVAVRAGNLFSLALGEDGGVYAWGANNAGQLGVGTTTASGVPLLLSAPVDAVALGSGGAGAAAITAQGGVWAWGDNSQGTFGNGAAQSSLLALDTAAPVVTSALSVSAPTGRGFAYQIGASNAPTGFTATGLPAGLGFNPATGVISGTPLVNGASSVTLGASNAAGASQPATLALTITVGEPNLACAGTASATSSPGASTPPGAAIDGNAATFWSSAASDPQSLTIDLGATDTIHTIILNWDPSGVGKDYLLQASADNTTWTTLKTVTGNTASGELTYGGLSGTGRYVRLYATARVNAGAGYAVRELQVFGSVPNAFPGGISGLQLRLQGDAGIVATGGSVSQWTDQSGHNNQATQPTAGAQPLVVAGALNGRAVVRFDASKGQYLQMSDFMSSATAGEIVVVLKSGVAATGVNNGLMRFGSSDDWYPYGSGNLYGSFGSGQYLEGVPAAPLNQFNIYAMSSQAGSWQSWVDGVPFFSSSTNTVGFTTAPALGVNNSGYYFTGDIAEVLVYNRALSDAERASVRAYLTQKYLLIPAPAAPAALSAKQLSPTENLVSWTGVPNGAPIDYVVQRATSLNGAYATIATVNTDGTYLDNSAVAGQAYFYRVYAQNAAGQSALSAAVAVVNPMDNGQTVPTGGLQLWLMGDGAWESPLNNWHDYSGNGHDATQPTAGAQPLVVAGALNGRAVVRFDASKGQYLQMPDFMSSATAGEVVVVVRSGVAATGVNNGLMRLGFGASDDWYPNANGNLYSSTGSTGQYLEGVPAQSLSQFNVYEESSQAGLWQSWVNGVPFFTSAANAVGFSTAPWLGRTNGYGYFTGDIAEVLVYNRALSDAERRSVRAYLTQKYLLAPAPAAPSSLSARQLSPTENLVSWTGVPNGAPIDYVVQRATSLGGPLCDHRDGQHRRHLPGQRRRGGPGVLLPGVRAERGGPERPERGGGGGQPDGQRPDGANGRPAVVADGRRGVGKPAQQLARLQRQRPRRHAADRKRAAAGGGGGAQRAAGGAFRREQGAVPPDARLHEFRHRRGDRGRAQERGARHGGQQRADALRGERRLVPQRQRQSLQQHGQHGPVPGGGARAEPQPVQRVRGEQPGGPVAELGQRGALLHERRQRGGLQHGPLAGPDQRLRLLHGRHRRGAGVQPRAQRRGAPERAGLPHPEVPARPRARRARGPERRATQPHREPGELDGRAKRRAHRLRGAARNEP